MEEVRDTVFLISKLLNLKEVVVLGEAPYKEENKDLQQNLRLSKTDLQLVNAKPGDGISLLGVLSYLIPKKWKKSKKEKRRERMKRVLEEY